MRVSRRAILAAAALGGCVGDAAARLTRLHITPDGTGDGSSWQTAAGLSDLDRLIASVRPGGEILIAADRGAYAAPEGIDIGAGGVEGGPVRIRGADSVTGAPMAAMVRGARREGETGREAFRLRRGASHLHFSHLEFRGVGNGCFRVCEPLSDLTIEDCRFEDVYRFLENGASEDVGHASMRRFAVRRCRGSRVQRGFSRVRYASREGVFEDCHAQGQANEGGHIPVGCALEDRASDIVYRRCVMEGFQQWRAGDYWNGDGFSDEEDNQRVRYERCVGRGSTDGGFDCKSPGVVLEACVAEDNKRNFRIWSDRATMSGCTSRNPNFRGREVETADACHLWIGAPHARIEVANLTIEDGDGTAIVEFEHGDASVELRGVRIESPRRNWGEVSVQQNADAVVVVAD